MLEGVGGWEGEKAACVNAHEHARRQNLQAEHVGQRGIGRKENIHKNRELGVEGVRRKEKSKGERGPSAVSLTAA